MALPAFRMLHGRSFPTPFAARQHASRSRSTIKAAAAAPSDQPKATGVNSEFFTLRYTYVPDILEKRDAHRQKHLDLAKEWGKDGKLVLAGAHQEPVDSALFVFKGASIQDIEGFVASDPYVINSLVTDSVIRPLATVVAP